MPILTVIMLSYNHGKYISEAIESVLSQTYGDFEFLIIENGSTDGSKKLIEKYSSIDRRIVPIFNDENLGIAGSRNKALNQAKGKFMAFIDSDDIWVPNKLEKQMKILETNEDLVVSGEAEVIDASNNLFGITYSDLSRTNGAQKSGRVLHDLLKRGNFVPTSSLILKTERAREIGFNENLRYMDDYRFLIQLAKKLKFYWIQEPIVKYRLHGSNAQNERRVHWDNDGVEFATIILKEDSNEINRGDKSIILWDRGRARFRLGKWKNGLYDLLNASLANPLTIILLRLINPIRRILKREDDFEHLKARSE